MQSEACRVKSDPIGGMNMTWKVMVSQRTLSKYSLMRFHSESIDRIMQNFELSIIFNHIIDQSMAMKHKSEE
jgi:hypothetical protein